MTTCESSNHLGPDRFGGPKGKTPGSYGRGRKSAGIKLGAKTRPPVLSHRLLSDLPRRRTVSRNGDGICLKLACPRKLCNRFLSHQIRIFAANAYQGRDEKDEYCSSNKSAAGSGGEKNAIWEREGDCLGYRTRSRRRSEGEEERQKELEAPAQKRFELLGKGGYPKGKRVRGVGQAFASLSKATMVLSRRGWEKLGGARGVRDESSKLSLQRTLNPLSHRRLERDEQTGKQSSCRNPERPPKATSHVKDGVSDHYCASEWWESTDRAYSYFAGQPVARISSRLEGRGEGARTEEELRGSKGGVLYREPHAKFRRITRK